MLALTLIVLSTVGRLGFGDDLLAPGISRDLARARSEQIADVSYEVGFDLEPGSDSAEGTVAISFTLTGNGLPVIVDFDGEALYSLTVNGQRVEPIERIANHAVLPTAALQAGRNTCVAAFRTAIAQSGTPLTVYRDSSGSQDILYTLVVPADAHRLFPCFDQPDLKARFQLSLDTPAEWQAVANGPVLRRLERETPRGLRTRWIFGPSAPISTYVMAFAAGPFERLEDPDSDLVLYLRPEKVELAEPAELFRLHRAALEEMASYFGRSYPFEKLELVLAPGFPYGGMEHAGAIFYRETSLVFDHVPSDRELLGRSTLIFHEVAHQWFGNLVTMEWFDDLWLKEGFATFIAYRTLARLRPDLSPWLRFHQSVKPRATAVDATRGTTPVYQPLSNLADAKSAYGAIVYNKAPAILRQLEYVLGEDTFRNGVRRFLAKHAFGNATWRELIAAFEEASERSLSAWAKAWIESPGMPRVELRWQVDSAGKLSEARLVQSSVQGDGRLWPIASRGLLLSADGDEVLIDLELDTAEKRLDSLIGGPAPVLVFPNADDLGYGEFLLDERSQRVAQEQLPSLRDPFLRMLLVTALWETVRAGEAPPARHVELIGRLLREIERDPLTVDILLGQARTALWRYMSDSQRRKLAPRLTGWIRDRLEDPDTPPALAITLFRALPSLPLDAEDLELLERLLAEEASLPAITVSQRDRWDLVTALIAQQHPRASQLLLIESQRDESVDAERYAYIAGAALASESNKAQMFDTYLQPTDPPEQWVAGSLSRFNAPGQESLTLPYLRRALSQAEWVKANRKIFFMPAWLDAFVNGHDSAEALAIVNEFLAHDDLAPDIRSKLLQSVDGLERAVRVRARFAK